MSSPVFIESAGLSGVNLRPRRTSLAVAGLSGLGEIGEGEARTLGALSVGISGLLGYFAYRQFKKGHEGWGALWTVMALTNLTTGSYALSTGKSLLGLSGLRRTGSGKGGTPDDSI